jgi:hypothetical protein
MHRCRARRLFTIAGVTMIATLAAGSVAQAASPEYKVSFTADHVRSAHDATDVATFACGIAGEFAPKFVGRLCDATPAEMTQAFTEAYHRECGVDMYVVDGPYSYDASQRFVVCP